MRRFTALVLLASLGVVASAQAGSGLPVRELLRVASSLSGLHARAQPRVVVLTKAALRKRALALADRDYPPAAQAYDERLYRALGLLGPTEPLRPALVAAETSNLVGAYDPVRRTVYVASGKTARAAAVQELVHALQDQSYSIRKAFAVGRRGRDAALAAAAANEGTAQLFVRSLPSSALVQRAPQAAGTTPIHRFLALEHGFGGSTGLRFAANLNNVGGHTAVVDALRHVPTTTAQIFHLDAFLERREPLPVELSAKTAGWELTHDDTFGELDVRALLAIFEVPRLNAVGDGWGAGLSAEYADAYGRHATVLRLDWLTDLDAAEWSEAVATYVNEAFDAETPGPPAPTACAADSCWVVGGRAVGFARDGARTVLTLLPGGDAASAGTLAKSLLS